MRTLNDTNNAIQELQILKMNELPLFLTKIAPSKEPSKEDIFQCGQLLQKLISSQQQIGAKINSLKQSVEQRQFSKGIGYYNAKNVLFMEYLINLEFYELFKINGVDLTQGQGLALYQRLVYLKTLMTKLGPIQKKLEYQKNKLLKYSDLVNVKADQKKIKEIQEEIQEDEAEYDEDENEGDVEREQDDNINQDDEQQNVRNSKAKQNRESDEDDDLAYQPRPQALLKVKHNKDKQTGKDGKYVAPKISATLSKEDKVKRRQQMQLQRRKAFLIRKYRGDLIDDDEAREDGVENELNQKVKRKFREKTDLQEENFMRLPETRQQKYWKKNLIKNQSRNNDLKDELKNIKMIGQIFQEQAAVENEMPEPKKRKFAGKTKVQNGHKKVKRN